MAEFDRGGMTQLGVNLMGKAMTGATIQFTKLVLGEGDYSGEIVNLTGVVAPIENVDVSRIERNDNMATLGGDLLTKNVTKGFFWKETGLYAMDPDLGEILYCYTSCSKPDFVAPSNSGLSQEILVNMCTAVGTDTNVTITIEDGMVFATKKVVDGVVSRTTGYVNVEEYRHLVTKATDSDGVEYDDWAAALQAAFTQNDRIEIPSGTFYVSKPVRVSDYKLIKGNGRKTLIAAKVPMECVLSIANYVHSISYTLVENLYVSGNNVANIGIKCVGFTNNSCMRNIWIDRCLEDGLYVTKAWYCSFEKMMIRSCKNGMTLISTGTDVENETNNINAVKFSDIFIAFHSNNGINMPEGSGYGLVFSNCTIEACENHGVYIKRIDSVVLCENVYLEAIKGNGYQVDEGYCLNLVGGYINVSSSTSRCVSVGPRVSKLIIKGTSTSYWGGSLEYSIYSEAKITDVLFNPLSTVTKRQIYYTGKFIGSLEEVMSGNGGDGGHDMSSLATKKISLTQSVSYGVSPNVEFIRGNTVKAGVDPSRIYQYRERTTCDGGWGGSIITLYAAVNDADNTEKEVYRISNGFFIPTRLAVSSCTTANRPTEKAIGSMVYDTTLKKPIWWNGTSWTDAMGTEV